MSEYIRLKEANCKNCYKCIRHCPVKSISFSENQASLTRSAMAVKPRKKNLCRQLSKFFPKMLRTIRCWFLIT